jgi:hypothetical protein
MAKVLTKHPLGKNGQSINRDDYDLFKQAIVAALRGNELTHTDLVNELTKSLKGKFQATSVGTR